MNKNSALIKSLLAISILIIITGLAQPRAAVAQALAVEKIAVLFILDDSGSMKANDPSNLRYTAAKLFIASLDDGDAVGAIRFSTDSSAIIDGIVTIADAKTKSGLIDQLQPQVANGYTDVLQAFSAAQVTLSETILAGYKTIAILLTDGKPEVQNPYKGYEDDTLKIARELGVPVYAIALTPAGQTAFLNRVASETGGKVIPARTANDLLSSYLQILSDLKDRTVMGEGSQHSPGQLILSLDPALMPYVSKVTFIVSKDPAVAVRLSGPDGNEVQSTDPMVTFAMTSDPGFFAYTITSPASGDWKFALSGDGSAQVRAILHSRLRTKIISPYGLVEAGQPVNIVVNLLEEQDDGSVIKIVGEASFSALVGLPDGTRQSLDSFYDDGTHGDSTAGDGNFSRTFVETGQPGSYSIAVRGLKGVVPVTAATQIEAVPFPQILVDEPSTGNYEIRDNTVPLRAHFDLPNSVEAFEGILIAKVTGPNGQTALVSLPADKGVFSGEYLPTVSGNYHVEFIAENAYFQGLPYEKQAATSFEALVVPQLTLQSVSLGLTGASSHDHFELQQGRQGIPLLLTVRSTSSNPEQVTATLEDLPGFSLIENEPLEVLPGGETNFTLHLLADAQAEPGQWTGSLALYPQGTVDVNGNHAPISFELFTPRLTVSSEVHSQCDVKNCWQWAPVKLILKTSSTSLGVERVNIQLNGFDGASLSQEFIEIQPGVGQMELEIKPNGNFKPGVYNGNISFSNPRAGVEVLPAQPLAASFSVDPYWVSCQKPLIFSGIGLIALLTVGVVVARKVRTTNKAPIVTGILTHWDKNQPELSIAVDISEVNKTQVSIGSGEKNDIVIADETVAEVHARILAEKYDDEIRLTLQPVGKVRKGYRETSDPMPLEEGITYQMGNRMFKYLRDPNQ